MQRYASTPRRDGLCRHRWGARTGHRCVYSRALRVCIHRVPLEGLEPLEPLLNIANVELSWHLVLLVADTDDPARAHAFDFRPRDASSPANLARLMTLGSTQGLTRSRPLNGVPSIRTSVLGDVRADLCALGLDGTVAVAEAWISRYDTRLTLLGNNCRHFAAGLASELCGRPVGPWRLS